MTNSKNSSTKYKTCPKCKYDMNESHTTSCLLCETTLLDKDEARILQNTHSAFSKAKNISSKNSFGSSIKSYSKRWKNSFLAQLSKQNANSNLRELQKPLNLLGLFFVALGLMLWINYYFVIRPEQNIVRSEAKETRKIEPIEPIEVPQGLFSYGGAPIFAPLVASGINGLIETKYPGYELRYTKPLNQDYSSFNGIRMLIDGELSFAYNERPLTDEEYKIAKLRNINLKQIPIALDGVVIYGNKQVNTNQLNREQLLKIFLGEINNWHDIDPKIEDLPIVPVVVQNEDLQMLGITNNTQKLSVSTEYTANYTLALRKVISTTGSISFASATIVKNQQLIKMFDLSDGSSSDYVSPTVNNQLNIADFKSGRYPLTRRIFIVLREDGTLDQKAGLFYANYLNGTEGKNKIERVGLLPIANYRIQFQQ